MFGWRPRVRAMAVTVAVTASVGVGCRADTDPAPAARPPSRPNIVWIVAPSIDEIVPHLESGGRRTVVTATLDPVSSDAARARSVLLTGMAPADLGPRPPSGVRLVPTELRHAGYYTSRAGEPRHDLAVPPAGGGQDSALAPPGLLGAWDAAGPHADWRGKEKDWEHPCTVAFGCGGPSRGETPFFSLFNIGPSADGGTGVGMILAALAADGYADDTAVFALGVGAGRERFAVRWPRGLSPPAVDGAVSMLDLAPTALALAGRTIPSSWPGRSLLETGQMAPPSPDGAGRVAASPGKRSHPGPAPVAAAPSGYPTGGVFHVAPVVTLSCGTPGSTIVYTTEREPPFYWRLYRGPFRMRFWELRARCGRLGYHDSDIVTYAFDIE